MQMHATFVLKCSKCRLYMQQCNVMESCTMFMTFFPIFVIFILIWFFLLFCGKRRLTVPFSKDVITHPTSSYLFANLFESSLRVYVMFDSVTWQFWSDSNGVVWWMVATFDRRGWVIGSWKEFECGAWLVAKLDLEMLDVGIFISWFFD